MKLTVWQIPFVFRDVEDKQKYIKSIQMSWKRKDAVIVFVFSDDSASFRSGVHRSGAAYMVRKIRRGNIYYANLNPAIGSEQKGVRPVVVVSNNVGNDYGSTVIIVPITSRKMLKKLPTHYRVPRVFGLSTKSWLLFEQIRVIDK